MVMLEFFGKRQSLCWFGLGCCVKSQEKLFYVKERVLASGEAVEALSLF